MNKGIVEIKNNTIYFSYQDCSFVFKENDLVYMAHSKDDEELEVRKCYITSISKNNIRCKDKDGEYNLEVKDIKFIIQG